MNKLKTEVKKLKVVSVGHITHDRYDQEIVLGGCAYFGAAAAHFLGAESRLLSAVGTDLHREKVPPNLLMSLQISGKTTVFTNLYPPGQNRVQIVESQAPPINSQLYPPNWKDPNLLFIAPVMGELDPTDNWNRASHCKFATLSLQGYLKKGHGDNVKREVVKAAITNEEKLFSGIDAVFFSEEDLDLFGSPQLLKRIKKQVEFVYVTAGEQGCHVYHHDQTTKIGIYPTNTQDPTGAGDTFAMATSLALAAGANPKTAGLFGASAASVIVEQDGSLNLPQLSEKAWPRFQKLVSQTCPEN